MYATRLRLRIGVALLGAILTLSLLPLLASALHTNLGLLALVRSMAAQSPGEATAVDQRSATLRDWAIGEFESALSYRSDNVSSMRWLGWTRLSVGQDTEGLATLEHALGSDPDDFLSRYYLSQAYERLASPTSGMDEATRNAYRRRAATLATASGTPVLLRAQGLMVQARLFRDRGEHAEAVAALREALRASPGDAYGRLLLGVEYYEAGDPDASARELLVLLPAAEPSMQPAIYAELGMAYQLAGKLIEARENYRRAIALDPHNGDAITRLAQSFRIEGDVQGEADVIERHLSGQPMPVEVTLLYYLGSARLQSGDTQGAVDAFNRLLAVNPDRADIRQQLDRAVASLSTG